MAKPLAYIAGASGIGAFGKQFSDLEETLVKGICQLTSSFLSGEYIPAGMLPEGGEELLKKHPLARKIDKSVLLALMALEECFKSGRPAEGSRVGISIGTSRGLTRSWESGFQSYMEGKPVSPFVSPVTTPGNLTSILASQFGFQGPELTVSMTCASGMAAILNGLAWLSSGWVDDFIAGGSESSLTPFTLAQAKALHLYSALNDTPWPCRPLDQDKTQNTMVLGEGAGVLWLSRDPAFRDCPGITGFGAAREDEGSMTGISDHGDAFYHAMQQALCHSPGPVDAILVHAPGTIKGDHSEYQAIQRLFGVDQMPVCYPLKAFIGHTYGASGPIAVLAAMVLLKRTVRLPGYFPPGKEVPVCKRVLVNSAGFGGQSISLLIEAPKHETIGSH